MQGGAFWRVLTIPKTSMGFIFSKKPKLGWNVDFQVKQKHDNFSTVHAIASQIGSIGAVCQN
jgi:hypothetical protein